MKHLELLIYKLPKDLEYTGSLPVRFDVNYIKCPQYSAEPRYFGLNRAVCTTPGSIHICQYYKRTDKTILSLVERWIRLIYVDCKCLCGKTDGLISEYDESGKLTKQFEVYDIFPTEFNTDDIYAYNVGELNTAFNFERTGNLKLFEEKEDKSSKQKSVAEKIKDRLSWDEYFMNIAVLASLRSKDESTKVGAVIVDKNNRLIGMGYNGLPSHIDESKFPTKREGELHETKYAYVTHAELNAILNTSVFDLSNSKIYCTLFPCCECAKAIIQKNVSEVIYLSDKHHDESSYIASRKLFKEAGTITRQYNGRNLLL